jgi:hypothetical protein
MTSQRRGFDPAMTVHGSRYGTNQNGGYIRAGGHNEYSDSEFETDNAGGLHDIACISLP